jgi:hypothetical protein
MPTTPAPSLMVPTAAVTWLIVSVLAFIAQHPVLTAAAVAVLVAGTFAIVRALHGRTVSVWRGQFRPAAVRPVFAGT